MKKPNLIYKFREINDYTKDSIKESYLWFSPASALNDPFDLQYQLSPEFIQEILEKSANDLQYQMQGNQLNKIVIDQFIENVKNEPRRRDELMRYIRTQIGYSICCFTEKKDDVLMWSHYAKDHTGICLIYDPYKMPQSLGIFNPITYSKEYPICSSYDEVNIKGVFTKSIHWRYECEWRIAKFMEQGKVSLGRECLKGIIFGRRTDLKTMKEIYDICKQAGYNNLDYFGIQQSPIEYKLTAVKATPQIVDRLENLSI